MATPEAIHYIGQSHLETEEKLGPDSTGNPQLHKRKRSLDGSFSSGSSCSIISLQAIKKKWEKSIAKALSIPHWKDGKNIFPSKERHDNFQLQAFQCVILSCLAATKLKPEYLPQT